MRTGSADDGVMGRRRAWAWVAVIAIAIGVVGTGAAQAQGPGGKAAGASTELELERCTRLSVKADELPPRWKYNAAFHLSRLAFWEEQFSPNAPYTPPFVDRSVADSLDHLAMLYRETADYMRAEPLLKRALAIRKKALGPNHPDVAISLHNLALLYLDRREDVRAEPLLNRALTIREKALGPNHPDVAISLHSLALLYLDRRKDVRAEPLLNRALAIRQEAFGPGHPAVARSLSDLAVLYAERGDDARAERSAARALATREKTSGPDHSDVAASLHSLAGLHREKGDYARAEPLYQRALAIREKALGPDHPLVADSLRGLARLYRHKAEYTRAELLLNRALAIREKAFGPKHPDVANSLNDLAMLCNDTAEYTRAEQLVKRALTIWEKAFGPNHPDVANSLDNLGTLYIDKGDYARAEPLYQRALTIREKALGSNHPDVATSLSNLAALYAETGDYARAEPLYQRALTIREKALGSNHPEVATSLHDLATMYATMYEVWEGEAEFAEAVQPLGRVPLLERALAISEKTFGCNHPAVATSLSYLAAYAPDSYSLYQRALTIREKALGPQHPAVATSLDHLADRSNYARAVPLYERALAIREKAFGPNHPSVAISLQRLANVYMDEGDYARAEALLQRDLAISEKARGPQHPVIAVKLHGLTRLSVAQGQIDQAVSSARRATEIEDRNAVSILAIGSEEQKRLYTNTLTRSHEAIRLNVQHAPTNPDATRLALTVVLRRKARVLDAMTDSLAALSRSLAPSDRELLARLTSIYSRLATELSRGPENASPKQYAKSLAALEDERNTVEVDVGRRSAALRAEQRLVSLPDVQAAIPKGAVLVEIARYALFEFAMGARPSERRYMAYGYVAYVLGRNGDPTFVDLGEVAPIEAAVEALRRSLADHDLTHDPVPAARTVDRLLMQPIRKVLGDTRWVFVSADGSLHLVPFGALVDEQGHYLVERYLFSYLTTGRDLLRFSDKPAAPREAPLVLANVAYDDSRAPPAPAASHRGVRSIDMVTQPLFPLGGTEEEATTIHSLFRDSRVLLGADATEEAVKAARAPRLLHLATHGFFLPEKPVPEVLLRFMGPDLTPAERAALRQRENPLLRSGIALAGFNRRRSGSDDGVLTALEVAGLDLHGTQLVVLSACETGVGEASSGEGVYGLRRALMIAGSQTQVMSLWQVDSGRTRELMQAYYQRLQQGAGRSEAMRQVQLAMLADPATSHPNLWASFIVSGDWRPLERGDAAPDLQVHPGPRGCACSLESKGGKEDRPSWVLAVVALAILAERRRRRAYLTSSQSSSPSPLHTGDAEAQSRLGSVLATLGLAAAAHPALQRRWPPKPHEERTVTIFDRFYATRGRLVPMWGQHRTHEDGPP